MTRMQTFGRLVAADPENRTLDYKLLPFNEEGSTNLGRVTVAPGTVELPADPSEVTLNLEHDPTRPVGRATQLDEREDGIYARFQIAPNVDGDNLLVEADPNGLRLRAGISVEFEPVVIRAGRLVRGYLDAAGAVVKPAFPSARSVSKMLAADCGDLPTPTQEERMDPENTAPERLQASAAEDVATAVTALVQEVISGETADEEDVVDVPSERLAASHVQLSPNAAMLAATAASGRPTPGNAVGHRIGPNRRDAMRMIAGAFNAPGGAARMLAAFTDIDQGDVYDAATEPQWIGEVYARRQYTRRFAPLIGHDTLTGMKVKGFKFTSEPDVADWAGLGANVPSGPVTAEEVEEVAQRLAGGWAIDRVYRDFPNPQFWDALFRKAFQNYDKKVDGKVPAALLAAAGTVPGTADALGAAPAGVSKLAHLLVEAGTGMVDDYIPTFALAHPSLYKAWAKTITTNDLAYVKSSFGLDASQSLDITIVPWSGLATDTLLVGAKDSATLYELPGTPVKVDAESLSRGAVEEAIFGYWAILIEDAAKSLRYVKV